MVVGSPVQASDREAAPDCDIRQDRGSMAGGGGEYPCVPSPTGSLAVASAEQRLQAHLTALDRQALDKGGWRNPFVQGEHYAAGASLQEVPAGSGITSRVVPPPGAPRYAGR
jgi:hypothetical protein